MKRLRSTQRVPDCGLWSGPAALFTVALALALLAAPLGAEAQGPGKAYRIGWLSTSAPTAPESGPNYASFVLGLRELGYVDGQNLFIESRYDEGKPERLNELAAELVRLQLDVIVAVATPKVRAVQQATKTIPIVMVAVVDPVGAGLVASLGRPGGNTTGLSILSVELSGKRLELLKEVAPGVSHVAVLWNPNNRSNALQLEESTVVAQAMGVTLQPLAVRGPHDVEDAFQAATRGRANALIALDDPAIFIQRARIVALAAKSGLPAVYGLTGFAETGGLMSYGTNMPEHFRRAATYVDKILKGAKPADIPVEQPTTFELQVNLKTAKALGLTIPQSLLLRADRVIE